MSLASADTFPSAANRSPREREFLGHPIGLVVLFFAEMWERFSYYGMRALLIYYMTKKILLAGTAETVLGLNELRVGVEWVFGPLTVQRFSSQIYGLYTAFVYLTPLAGGFLADRFIGQRKAVVIGGLIMAAGQFVLMSPTWFLPGLLLLIVGNGFFKPNVSTQVGGLYKQGDPRRDRAFGIYYVGINVGGTLAPLVCGALGELYGWHYGFGSAGVGMLLGLGVYIWGQHLLAPDNLMKEKSAAKVVERAPFSKQDWSRIGALIVLCLLNVLFWAVYEQQGNTLALWADQNTNRHIFQWAGSDWEMPASWFQAVNGTFILLLTPFISMLWKSQAAKGKEPNSVAKMAIGCAFLAASFVIMIAGAYSYAANGPVSILWLISCSLVLTTGELYLSPVGLSLVTKISPQRIVSMMMGMWFLSYFLGNYLSGYIGMFWEVFSKQQFFLLLAGLSAVTGIAMVVLYRPLKRAIGDENAAA